MNKETRIAQEVAEDISKAFDDRPIFSGKLAKVICRVIENNKTFLEVRPRRVKGKLQRTRLWKPEDVVIAVRPGR